MVERRELDEQEVFEYLDHLRDSGVTNMFGGTPYLMIHFTIGKREARKWLQRWMDTYSERHPQHKEG